MKRSPIRDVDAAAALEQLFDLAVVLGDLMHRRLEALGLTPARAEVLWLLHRAGPLTQRELSQTLKCSPRNVTGLVDALEAAGFVARKPHPTDRRAILVTLTEQGHAVASAWSAEHREGAGQLFGDISAADLASFVAVLDRVLGRLRDQPTATSPAERVRLRPDWRPLRAAQSARGHGDRQAEIQPAGHVELEGAVGVDV